MRLTYSHARTRRGLQGNERYAYKVAATEVGTPQTPTPPQVINYGHC